MYAALFLGSARPPIHVCGPLDYGHRLARGRQRPSGNDGMLFFTIEGETGNLRLILWPQVFVRDRRKLGSLVVQVTERVSRWDGTTNALVSEVRRVDTRVPMPTAHN